MVYSAEMLHSTSCKLDESHCKSVRSTSYSSDPHRLVRA